MKKRLRGTIRGLCLLLILAALATSVYAGNAYSTSYTYSAGSYSYTNQALVQTASASMGATTYLTANTTVPAGYLGVKARMLNSAGTIIGATDMYYSTSASSSKQTAFLFGSNYPSGAYRSQGITQGYNGTSYVENYTYATPYQNYPDPTA